MNVPRDKCPFCNKILTEKVAFEVKIKNSDKINLISEFQCKRCVLDEYSCSKYFVRVYHDGENLIKNGPLKSCYFIVDNFEITMNFDTPYTKIYKLPINAIYPCLQLNQIIDFDFSAPDKLKDKIKTLVLFS